MTIQASAALDYVVKVMDGSMLVRAVFVPRGATTEVTGIPDGTYQVYFSGGHDWDDASRRFTQDCHFFRVDRDAAFRTTNLSTSVEYPRYTLRLWPDNTGTASTRGLDPSEFPAA